MVRCSTSALLVLKVTFHDGFRRLSRGLAKRHERGGVAPLFGFAGKLQSLNPQLFEKYVSRSY